MTSSILMIVGCRAVSFLIDKPVIVVVACVSHDDDDDDDEQEAARSADAPTKTPLDEDTESSRE